MPKSPTLRTRLVHYSRLFLGLWAVFVTIIIIWVVAGGLFGRAVPLSHEHLAPFDIDGVSGFYGPGSWGAWVLTVASCCLERALTAEKAIPEKHSHVLGLDLNVAIAYGYPFVTAIDLQSQRENFNAFRDDQGKRLGRFAASCSVLLTGVAFGILVAAMSVRVGQQTEQIFGQTLVSVSTIVLSTILGFTEILYLRTDCRNGVNICFLFPFWDLFFTWDKPETCASPIWRAYITSILCKIPAVSISSFQMFFALLSNAGFVIMVLVGVSRKPGMSIWEQIFIFFLFGFVICTFMWWILQLHLYVVLNFLPIVADLTPYVPTTNAVVTDLDQLAAFILSG
jgi:hypothetical protein